MHTFGFNGLSYFRLEVEYCKPSKLFSRSVVELLQRRQHEMLTKCLAKMQITNVQYIDGSKNSKKFGDFDLPHEPHGRPENKVDDNQTEGSGGRKST